MFTPRPAGSGRITNPYPQAFRRHPLLLLERRQDVRIPLDRYCKGAVGIRVDSAREWLLRAVTAQLGSIGGIGALWAR